MKNYLLALAVLVLGGCAFTQNTYDEKGNPAVEVRCSWAFPEACYKKVDELCPKGYRTVSKDMEFNLFKNQHVITVVCKQ